VAAYTKGPECELIDLLWMPRLEESSNRCFSSAPDLDAHRDDDLGQMGLVEQHRHA
jgi:hypothetical protein